MPQNAALQGPCVDSPSFAGLVIRLGSADLGVDISSLEPASRYCPRIGCLTHQIVLDTKQRIKHLIDVVGVNSLSDPINAVSRVSLFTLTVVAPQISAEREHWGACVVMSLDLGSLDGIKTRGLVRLAVNDTEWHLPAWICVRYRSEGAG